MVKSSRARGPLLPWPDVVSPPADRKHTDRSLAAALTQRLGRPIEVAFGRSRTLPVQMLRRGGMVRLRLHAFFAAAPDDVVDALAGWMMHGSKGRCSYHRLDDWIDAELRNVPRRTRAPLFLRPRGAVYDLGAFADELCAGPWLRDLTVRPRLTWGRARQAGGVRKSILLGLYDPDTDIVQVHPVLDHASVPGWFVRCVLFHELLHAAIPPRIGEDGRWVKHGPEFRRRERAFADTARADAWLDRNIGRLLRAARDLPRTLP